MFDTHYFIFSLMILGKKRSKVINHNVVELWWGYRTIIFTGLIWYFPFYFRFTAKSKYNLSKLKIKIFSTAFEQHLTQIGVKYLWDQARDIRKESEWECCGGDKNSIKPHGRTTPVCVRVRVILCVWMTHMLDWLECDALGSVCHILGGRWRDQGM